MVTSLTIALVLTSWGSTVTAGPGVMSGLVGGLVRPSRGGSSQAESDQTPFELLPPLNFPPGNPFISLGAWPTVHSSSYSQGSSPLCAPSEKDALTHDFLQNVQVLSNPITLFYTNDNEHLWGVSWTAVFRLKRSKRGLTRESSVRREIDDIFQDVFHGAYSILDRNEVFYTATSNRLEMYYNPPSISPQIQKFHTDFILSPGREGEVIRALVMLHDGHLAFCTNIGRVGIVTRLQPPHLTRSIPVTDNLPPDHPDSTAGSLLPTVELVAIVNLGEVSGVQFGELEMSNNIAADEDGGIYVVTDQFMHKIQWDSRQRRLEVIFETVYARADQGPVELDRSRLGAGSGSTPSLMGDRNNGRYIVLTDAEKIFNVVVINASSGNLEARHPVTFGLENPETTLSEQSILVYGWRFVVVNNTPRESLFNNGMLTGVSGVSGGPPVFESIANALPVIVGDAPYGVEQFEFHPKGGLVRPASSQGPAEYTGTIRSVWTNPTISIPNGIPTMSGVEQMMYGIGKRPSVPVGPNRAGPLRGTWTLEGLDWWTGRSRLHYNLGVSALYNSVYAATEIGPNCEIISGTLGGIVRIRGFSLSPRRRRPEDVSDEDDGGEWDRSNDWEEDRASRSGGRQLAPEVHQQALSETVKNEATEL
eukprot:GHVN01079600.1.p1 GENE.GHVN01079600.1~~GHVN01079600.1.p1  ORF type:complete len:648 (+),score=114.96 GHVN01079600.1:539-2482(+)